MFDMIFFSFSEKISCIIIAGCGPKSSVEVLTGDLGTKQLPNLPEGIGGSSMVLHNRTILLYRSIALSIRKECFIQL